MSISSYPEIDLSLLERFTRRQRLVRDLKARPKSFEMTTRCKTPKDSYKLLYRHSADLSDATLAFVLPFLKKSKKLGSRKRKSKQSLNSLNDVTRPVTWGPGELMGLFTENQTNGKIPMIRTPDELDDLANNNSLLYNCSKDCKLAKDVMVNRGSEENMTESGSSIIETCSYDDGEFSIKDSEFSEENGDIVPPEQTDLNAALILESQSTEDDSVRILVNDLLDDVVKKEEESVNLLCHQDTIFTQLSPVLPGRGYAITYSEEGKVIKEKSVVTKDEDVIVKFLLHELINDVVLLEKEEEVLECVEVEEDLDEDAGSFEIADSTPKKLLGANDCDLAAEDDSSIPKHSDVVDNTSLVGLTNTGNLKDTKDYSNSQISCNVNKPLVMKILTTTSEKISNGNLFTQNEPENSQQIPSDTDTQSPYDVDNLSLSMMKNGESLVPTIPKADQYNSTPVGAENTANGETLINRNENIPNLYLHGNSPKTIPAESPTYDSSHTGLADNNNKLMKRFTDASAQELNATFTFDNNGSAHLSGNQASPEELDYNGNSSTASSGIEDTSKKEEVFTAALPKRPTSLLFGKWTHKVGRSRTFEVLQDFSPSDLTPGNPLTSIADVFSEATERALETNPSIRRQESFTRRPFLRRYRRVLSDDTNDNDVTEEREYENNDIDDEMVANKRLTMIGEDERESALQSPDTPSPICNCYQDLSFGPSPSRSRSLPVNLASGHRSHKTFSPTHGTLEESFKFDGKGRSPNSAGYALVEFLRISEDRSRRDSALSRESAASSGTVVASDDESPEADFKSVSGNARKIPQKTTSADAVFCSSKMTENTSSSKKPHSMARSHSLDRNPPYSKNRYNRFFKKYSSKVIHKPDCDVMLSAPSITVTHDCHDDVMRARFEKMMSSSQSLASSSSYLGDESDAFASSSRGSSSPSSPAGSPRLLRVNRFKPKALRDKETRRAGEILNFLL
ncbi:unnamed protein product [Clavelina lepadiformis]|uniref:Uncharacterized protein n=1 Tax=Clavelina lepadiformis TaxID=159417 RepID=A0ABP0GZZ6_CLALP